MELLTTTEVLRVLGVTRAQFRGQLARGEITPVERAAPNGRMRFRRADVVRLKEMMRTTFVPPVCRRQPASN